MLTRQKLRQFFVDMLIAEKISDVGEDRVYGNRPTPLFMPELPAICVYTGSRPAGSETIKERGTYQDDEHDLPITVEILVPANESVDDTLDVIAEKVERALGRIRYAGPNGQMLDREGNVMEDIGSLVPESVEVNLAANGETVIGSLKQGFSITYVSGLGDDLDGEADVVSKIHTDINDSTDKTRTLVESEQTFQ